MDFYAMNGTLAEQTARCSLDLEKSLELLAATVKDGRTPEGLAGLLRGLAATAHIITVKTNYMAIEELKRRAGA